MIHVIATVQLQPGKRAEFIEHFHRLVPEVKAEQGCLEYGPTVDVPTGIPVQTPPDENVVVVVEQWTDLPALEAHLAAPHMLKYREVVKDLVVGTTLRVTEPA